MALSNEQIEGKIPVLQVLDKCAAGGATIHGVSRLLLTWWPAFEESDFSFHLCVLRGCEGGVDELQNSGIDVTDMDRHRLDPRTILDLIKIIRKDGIRVIHCHGYGSTTFGRVAATICGIPAIVHEHMIDDSIPGYQKAVDFLLSPFTAKGIAVSKAVAEFMIEHRYVRRNKIEVLYNAVSQSCFCKLTADEKEGVARSVGTSRDLPLIGIVGRLDPVKGHTYFLDAARRVLEEFPQAEFAIVGDGDLLDELQSKAKKMSIDRNVIFLGHRNDVLEVMSLFDVYVNCSTAEGLGIANIEAMALGKPIVGTSVGGIPELIENGVTGVLVPPKDAASLAAAIIRLLFDQDLRDRLGNNALIKSKKEFAISGIAVQLQDIYHGLILDA